MQRTGENRTGRRRWLHKIGLALGGVLVALVVVELTLRVLGLVLVASQVETPADPASAKPVFTILCAGDSWTQGADSGRYPDYLVARLNGRADGARFRQINVGRAGTNSSQGLGRLPEQIAAERPDLLLVLTGNNDHHNLTDSTYWRFQDASLDGSSILAARLRVFAHSTRVFRLGRTFWGQAMGGPTSNEFFERNVDGSQAASLVAIDPATHRRQLEYNLTRFVELARREGIPIVFQTYFHFHGYHVNEIVRDVASIHGIPLVDHNLLFHTRIPPEERQSYRIPDGHPNPAGYRAMAAYIVEVLDDHDLIPR